MKLYVDYEVIGVDCKPVETVELTPEYLDVIIENTAVFEKIGYSPQVIADLTVNRPDKEVDSVTLMMNKYNVTQSQARFALNLPLKYAPLFFDADECPRQIERIKTLRRMLQEMNDWFCAIN